MDKCSVCQAASGPLRIPAPALTPSEDTPRCQSKSLEFELPTRIRSLVPGVTVGS
ncbi:hypothetical protein BD626DRAFT_507321 [Schizophyllum amplum]|uniref:Uncharacterized protein n=1 Tax=Schizophyllum amplum TaxID=97359 RepID=A0A550C3Y2_9AGAR|nr:hypothetical protein BD626DRAFT_507321 [Auriculariopsis ampla]